MDNNKIKEFFNNPYSEEYINYCNTLIRQNVTAISVTCKLLEDFISNTCKNNETEMLDDIILHCRELMRGAVFGELLSAKSNDMTYVSTDVFVGEFVSGCREAFGGRVNVAVGERVGGYVKTDETVLRYLLLEFIRSISVSRGEPAAITIGSACSENGNLSLYINVKTDDGADFQKIASVPGGEDIILLLAEKIGVSCVRKNNSFTVEFSEKKEYIDPVFRCRPYYPSDGAFSAYNVMLSGILSDDGQIF